MRGYLALSLVVLSTLALVTLACLSPAKTPAYTPATSSVPSTIPNITPTAAQSSAQPEVPAPTPAKAKVPTPEAQPSGELRIATDNMGDEGTIPQAVGGSKAHLELMFDYMIDVTKDGRDLSPERSLIEKWIRAPDGRSWTFYVRKGVTFQDGSPLTAEDIKFTLETVVRPESTYTFAAPLKLQFKRAEVINPYELVVYTEPTAFFLYDISRFASNEGMVIPKAYIEKNGYDYFKQNPIGSGPYKLVKRTPGDFTLEAVPEHWQIGVPKYQTIRWLSVPEESTRIAMLRRNEVDWITVTREKAVELGKDGFNIFFKKDSDLPWVMFLQQWRNTTPAHDVRVREALNLAINREEILKFLLAGSGRPESNLNYSWALGYEKLPPYPYDPDRARQLLKEAGYSNGFDLNFFWFPHIGLPEAKQVAEAIAGYWSNIGLRVKTTGLEWGAFQTRWHNQEFPDPAVGMGILPARIYNTSGAYTLYHSGGFITSIKDPKLDKLIENSISTPDLGTAEKLTAEFGRYIRDNYLGAPLFSVNKAIASNQKIKEWQFGRTTISFDPRNILGSK